MMPDETPIPLDLGTPAFEAEAEDGEDSPKQSMEAMAEEAEEESEEEVDTPVSTCPKAWFELTALGPENEPLKDVPYKVDLPEVKQEGKLDGQGFLRIEDVEVEPGSYVVNVLSEEDSGGEPSYRVEVVPRQKQEQADLEPSFEALLDTIVPPWEPF
ncbi:MAG: hypothetical protein KDD47_17595 [Acidobacteria bacterium]|nr:hypothetical protein [Acidobacteriota bacterium]